MDEAPDRRLILIVAGLLIGGAMLASVMVSGGQTSMIRSTVGAAIGDTSGGSDAGSTGGDDGGDDGTGGSDPAANPTAAPGGGSDGRVAGLAALPPALLIIRTGTIDVEITDLNGAVRSAEAAIHRAGGYVDGSTRTLGGNDADAIVAYRIPSAAWDTALDGIRKLATRIRSEQIKTEEVSAQVVDLGARIANLRTTEAALQAIMAKATKISDVLDVQEQLTTTRDEIERLVASKADLEDRASYGSLTVSFRLPAPVAPTPTPVASPGWNPGADVELATAKLVSIGQGTTSLGIWLGIVGVPLLVAGAVLAFVTYQLVRLGRWLLARRAAVADPAG
jgi:hypothetical protein